MGYLCVENLEFIYHEHNNCYNKDQSPLMENHPRLMCVLITNLRKKISYFVPYFTSCLTSSLFINQTFKSSLNTMQIHIYYNHCHWVIFVGIKQKSLHCSKGSSLGIA